VSAEARQPLLTVEELAAFLNVGVQTIYNWRQQGKGPRALRLEGVALRFRWEDVDAWLDAEAAEQAT
jgi:excisionase family DNA binding protein